MNARFYQNLTSAALIALIFLCLAWEGWLAPLRPGGSWLTLKAIVLLAPLFGILRGKRYTHQWMSLPRRRDAVFCQGALTQMSSPWARTLSSVDSSLFSAFR